MNISNAGLLFAWSLTEKQVEKIGALSSPMAPWEGIELFEDKTLPKGWIEVIIKGVIYGIDPEGQAHS